MIRVLATIGYIPSKIKEIIDNAKGNHEIFDQDIPMAEKNGGLFIRQLQLEEEQEQRAYHEINESIKDLCKIGSGTSLKYMQRVIVQWYEPLCEAIIAEIKLINQNVLGKGRNEYGPALMLLPVEKLAVITLDITLNSILIKGNDNVFVTTLALKIGDVIESEVHLMKLKSGKTSYKPFEKALLKDAYADKKYALKVKRKILELLENTEEWDKSMKARIGSILLSLLVVNAKVNHSSSNLNAFTHSLKYNPTTHHKQGSELVRTFSKKHKEAIRRASMRPILNGLDYLGSIPWVINKKIYQIIEEAWERKLSIGEIPPQTDLELPNFRGRAYPIPPNLSHLGSDLCRGLLKFATFKKLGPNGLNWLKIHLANLYDNVYDSVRNPLDGSLWWSHADEPFQALATCIEITEALKCDNPEEYLCNLPVHQDGSCNGLQHYAALGKDELGGLAVNLLPSDKPQDVYSKVLEIVIRKINHDSEQSDNLIIKKSAILVKDIVDRKVIKQTVMTSVYGVTQIGAREQVRNRLNDKLISDLSKIPTAEQEKEIYDAAGYVAKLTLSSLNEMFSSAKDIMDWLATSASIVSSQGQAMSWISPLGLPVMQPYRLSSTQLITSSLQSISLIIDDDALPVSSKKQKSAFPPNFVHSLDATHMLMTCNVMEKNRLTFTAVHDSYWTHACDIPIMSEILRDCFIELYEKPILEDLRDSLVIRYPEVQFPELPQRGTLDIKKTKHSKYFFH
eukprot:gene17423-22974_t